MAVIATDNFNRANVNPIGGNWVTASGVGAMQIVSNAATFVTNTDSGAYYNTTWPNDHYSKAKITVNGTAGAQSGARLFVRHASGADTCYILVVDHAATNNVCIQKVVASVFTNLTGFPLTQAWTDGDTWELRVVGTTLSCYLNGTQIGSNVTDSAISSGFAGIGYSSVETSMSIDDWEGGDFTSTVNNKLLQENTQGILLESGSYLFQ